MIDKESKRVLKGLTDAEVAARRAEYGENLLTPPKRPSMWKLYWEKFKDPVIQVLLVAAFFSFVIAVIEQEFAETIGIFFAIFLATGIGFYFEYDAGKKFDLLNAVNEETPVTVLRNGKITEVPRKEIVVDDVVILNTGEEIPADGLLVEAISLQLNESNLTGEPVVSKSIDSDLCEKESTYPCNVALRGTTVVDGHGKLVITAVGDKTEIGKVAKQATEQSEEQTPLNIQLDKLAGLIGKVGFTVAILTFMIFTGKDLYLYFQAHEVTGWQQVMEIARIVLKYFMVAVTLIVVAVPEGLPMSVTLSLALNMRRMLKTNNLVRKMHACETMGAITVICTDKTGTLTQNLMQVHEAQLTPESESWIGEGLSVNSTAFLQQGEAGSKPTGVGNPTEVALLLWLHQRGIAYEPLREKAVVVDQLTFSTERKFMATLVQSTVHSQKVLYIKGAPEVVMSKSNLTETEQTHYHTQLLAYQNQAMRTLGVAYKIISEDSSVTKEGALAASYDCEALVNEGGLTFLGIFAISDPIRSDVPAAIEECQSAGVAVKIVTGDTPGTATEIARQIGLWKTGDSERNRITGVEFAALTDQEALERIADLKIMSRARPTDKQRLVQLLQQRGEVVAVTGDGTNDAPALNHAHVGLSMGTGTSVAKEASDITLLDDSFHSIATAVMWGRSLYKNIQRFIVFQLTINVVALISVLIGAFGGTELPLTVTQMLWVNLIMDTFAAMALASIPPTHDVMKEKPRKRTDFIISSAMQKAIFGIGAAFLVVLTTFLIWMKEQPVQEMGRLLTIFFTLFVMLQFWNLFNAAVFGTYHSIFTRAKEAKGMITVSFIILIGQILIVQFGGEVFRTEPLSFDTWIYLIFSSSLVLWVGELYRWIQRLRTP
ncbi:MAG: calcium-translocating P-type ATPase, PMCA-type [Phocaeicola sp.]